MSCICRIETYIEKMSGKEKFVDLGGRTRGGDETRRQKRRHWQDRGLRLGFDRGMKRLSLLGGIFHPLASHLFIL